MTFTDAPQITLMQLWRLHKRECRAIGSIVSDAREGNLSGVHTLPGGHGFVVHDHVAALTAMKKGAA